MKEIIIKTQEQYDKLPKSFKNETQINIIGDVGAIGHKENAIYSVYGNAMIKSVYGNAMIKSVSDNATINSVYDNATINSVSGNATINSVSGNATIKYVSGNATIKYVSGNATINSVSGNATIKIYSSSVNINRLLMQSIAICIDCHPTIKDIDITATAINKTTAKYTKEDFINIYNDNMIDDNHILLYKSVNENHFDFLTGKIKYTGMVECPDWDDNIERQRGGGLHLSPTPEMALQYNNGQILKCKVHINDFIVCPHDITKVRCKRVEVIEE